MNAIPPCGFAHIGSMPIDRRRFPPATDFLPLNGTDHVEFYVGNARQAAYFYRAAFGMRWWPMRDRRPASAIALRMWCSRERFASC